MIGSAQCIVNGKNPWAVPNAICDSDMRRTMSAVGSRCQINGQDLIGVIDDRLSLIQRANAIMICDVRYQRSNRERNGWSSFNQGDRQSTINDPLYKGPLTARHVISDKGNGIIHSIP